MFKIIWIRQTFYGITLSWKLLSCHSQAVRPCTQSFVHFSKGRQPLPFGIKVYVFVLPFDLFIHVHFSHFKRTCYNPDLFWINWLKQGLMVWISLGRGVAWSGFGRYYLYSVHHRSQKSSFCEKMKYLHSVVFPYGLCQPGNYTVDANGTVLLSSWSQWWLEFMFYDYTLYSAPGRHIDSKRKRAWRHNSDGIQHIFLQSSELMAVIVSKNPFLDLGLIHIVFHYDYFMIW